MKENFLNDCMKQFRDCYSVLKDDKIVLFGAAARGKMMVRALEDVGMKSNILAICDNDTSKWGSSIESIEICGIEEIVQKYENFKVIICGERYRRDIEEQLKNYNVEVFAPPHWEATVEQMLTLHRYKTLKEEGRIGNIYEWIGAGFEEKRVERVSELLADDTSKIILKARMDFLRTGNLRTLMEMPVSETSKQYFDEEVFEADPNEIFVDCGAFNGDTVWRFIKWTGGKYDGIYAFEPDAKNCHDLQIHVNTNAWKNVRVINKAVGEKKGMFLLGGGLGAGSHLSGEGDQVVFVTRIEDEIEEGVTYIKMDVEGTELEALQGAEGLIKRYKPKLAICIYHKREDPIVILEYLHELIPEYQFKIRHYTDSQHETVLYAYI